MLLSSFVGLDILYYNFWACFLKPFRSLPAIAIFVFYRLILPILIFLKPNQQKKGKKTEQNKTEGTNKKKTRQIEQNTQYILFFSQLLDLKYDQNMALMHSSCLATRYMISLIIGKYYATYVCGRSSFRKHF